MSTRTMQLKEQWNLSASRYSKHVRKYFTHRRITNLLVAGIDLSPGTILDFGCGPGNSTTVLTNIFPKAERIIGIDYSEEMLKEASKYASNKSIIFLLDDENFSSLKYRNIDVVFLSNSFFHLENKKTLLGNVKKILSRKGKIYFSMYESVFIPKDNIVWPFSLKENQDSLIKDIITKIRGYGYPCESRKEDREVFSENTLPNLFNKSGYNLELSGVINLQRKPDERISFLKIPAVSQEVFPNIPQDILNKVMDELNFKDYTIQERKVYSFTASLME